MDYLHNHHYLIQFGKIYDNKIFPHKGGNEMVNTHYFLAVPVPQEIKLFYLKWRDLVKDRLLFKSWVHHEDYHITLAFLGNASFSKIQDVKGEMERVMNKHHPFDLQLSGSGTFGQSDNPRILWAGVESHPNLESLQVDVYQACKQVGFELESRPYNPHMTLARRWVGEDPFPLNLPSISQLKEEKLSFTVNHTVLYQTDLNRSPKYLPISVFPLVGCIK